VVPTSALDRALWMESDRMGYPAAGLDARTVRDAAQRGVERAAAELREPAVRTRADGADVGTVPPEHPYRWPTIGDVADLEAMQFEQVREFFRTYYGPSNASLVLAGDIEPDRGFDLAERYFGDLSPGTGRGRYGPPRP
jgi:zinc protease